jgi:hypothetical protein
MKFKVTIDYLMDPNREGERKHILVTRNVHALDKEEALELLKLTQEEINRITSIEEVDSAKIQNRFPNQENP